MTFTPAHLARIRGSSNAAVLSPAELLRIRKLYLEKRYKQCIAACDENIESGLHRVHKAFLLFQQAISYEALGIAAHNYSRNKIPFLESAEDKFRESLEALPQPFTIDENGQCRTPNPSPLVTNFVESHSSSEQDISHDTPTPVINATAEYDFSDSSSDCSSQSHSSYSIAYSAPDFNKYSPRPDQLAVPSGIPRTVTFPDVDKQDQNRDSSSEDDQDATELEEDTPTGRASTTKLTSRLSASLSSSHVLADDLVPSPLFSRTKKTATIPFPALDALAEQASSSKTRPLPPAPYAHRTHLTLLPTRKTAVQTLISKYENTLPSPSPISILPPHTPCSVYTDATVPHSTSQTLKFTPQTQTLNFTTPITPRFALIHSIFTPFPNPTNNTHLATYLSSHSLARYNSALASFRTSIISAITSTSCAITFTRTVQETHAKEKRRTFLATSSDAGKRMASYWLLSTPTPAPTTREIPGQGSGGVRPKTWSGGGGRARPNQSAAVGSQEDEASTQKKKARIEKLRANGFRVRKENWGWKGMEYYEGLRHGAERDLMVVVAA